MLVAITPADRLDTARQQIADLEYEAAVDELRLVLLDPDASDEERLWANLLAGQANRVLGRFAEARLNFRYVLQRRPDLRLDRQVLGPKITDFFELVRAEVNAEAAAAAAPAPAPTPAPVPEPVATGGTWLVPALMGAGIVTAGTGLAAALWAEAALREPQAINERAPLFAVGYVGASAAGVGVLVAAGAGAAWMAE